MLRTVAAAAAAAGLITFGAPVAHAATSTLPLGCHLVEPGMANVLTGISGKLTPVLKRIHLGDMCYFKKHGVATDVGTTENLRGTPGKRLYNGLKNRGAVEVNKSLRLWVAPPGIAPTAFTKRWAKISGVNQPITLTWQGEHAKKVATTYLKKH